MKLSVVLATRNEEINIKRCLKSVESIADEIIVFDEYSTDKTREIAESLGARVYLEPHHDMFHITKQKAIDKAKGDWILQLDADEVVTNELAIQIKKVVEDKFDGIVKSLFLRHQKLIEERDGKIGKTTGEIVGYFIPRRNIFLGKPLIHAGVYPDGVIRLFKKGKAWFPQRSVHEQIHLDGRVSWLSADLLHYDSPTFERYLERFNRYTDLHAKELKDKNVSKNFWNLFLYSTLKPGKSFLNLYFRHLGIKDGTNGFIWSLFSSLHYPIAYFKYFTNEYNDQL